MITWYNYTYSYPDGYIKDGTDLTNIVFYVGKGTNSRINAHEKEARTGCKCDKCKAIREIWDNGYPVKKRLVFETLVEEEALKNEKDLIIKHSGEYLTNVIIYNGITKAKEPSLTGSLSKEESKALRRLLEAQDTYGITEIAHKSGRAYSISMKGEIYNAVVLLSSFQYYELQYHIAKQKPDLVVCYRHDSVLPIPVLSIWAGNLAQAYELPEEIDDLEAQRHSKIGARVLLGMYISGLRRAQDIIHAKSFPKSTRNRYLQKARELSKRRRGRPVTTAKG
jgi:hypothetical protein